MSSSHSIPKNIALIIARILISYIFISAGITKIPHFSDTIAHISSQGLPLPALLAVLAIVVEIVGGLMILLGFHARVGALALAVFVIIITPIFHDYWNVPASEVVTQMINLHKNMAILGGLIYVIVCGAGRFALTRCHRDKSNYYQQKV
jgi:putative oxidoreductase